MTLEVRIRKRLSRDFALDVDFRVENAALGILGASGCGKSMTLKCIAGIETPDGGRIVLNGRTLYDSDKRINLKPQERRVGMLFQNYALFPQRDVAGNIGIGIAAPAGEKAERVARWVARMRLGGLEKHLPSQLSGGQQQRVALARMLAAEPELILLDEPFSALDSHLREQVQLEVRGVIRNHAESIMVTHSRDEAYRLCDELLVMEGGRALGGGNCRELFRSPGSRRIAQLTGCKNFSRAVKLGERRIHAQDWDLRLETALPVGGDIRHVGIRAHDLVPAGNGIPAESNTVALRITERVEDPFEWNVFFANAESPRATAVLCWKFSKYYDAPVPERLRLPPEALLLLTDP